MKYCNKCNADKELSEFYKDRTRKDSLSIWCKECTKEYRNQYYIDNKKEIIEKRRIYQKTKNGKYIQKKYLKKYRNSEKYKKYQKEYRQTERGKEIIKGYSKNRIKSGKHAKYERDKRNNDLNHKIRKNLSTRIYQVLKGKIKSQCTLDLLGCDLEFLKQHLQSQFKDGMTWENQGRFGWHIDHYIPCSYFDLSDPEQQKICFNWRNLQPLWREENCYKKRDKVPDNVEKFIQNIKQQLKLVA